MIPYSMLTHPERLAVQMREAKMRQDILDRHHLRMQEIIRQVADGWSFYDREALRSGHVGYDRENYGL